MTWWRQCVHALHSAFASKAAPLEDALGAKQAQEAIGASPQTDLTAAVCAGSMADVRKLAAERLASGKTLSSKRGAMGESLLHLGFLFGKLEVARLLIDAEPAMLATVYEGETYCGENSLHITIAGTGSGGNLAEARYIVSRCPWLVWGRAHGTFFAKPDAAKASEGSTAKASAYYGELPLNFAVSTNQADFVTFLVVECGVWISAGDRHGNTAAHMCVQHRRLEMYTLLEKLWHAGYGRAPQHADTPSISALRNRLGQTPLVMAAAACGSASEGEKGAAAFKEEIHFFSELLKLSKTVLWKWGNVKSHVVSFDDIDDVAQELHKRERATGATCRRAFEPCAVYALPPTPPFQPYSISEEDAPRSLAPPAAKPFDEAARFCEPQVWEPPAALAAAAALPWLSAGDGAAAVSASANATPLDLYAPPAEAIDGPFPTVLEVAIEHANGALLNLPIPKMILEMKWRKWAYARFLRSKLRMFVFMCAVLVLSYSRSVLRMGTFVAVGSFVDALHQVPLSFIAWLLQIAPAAASDATAVPDDVPALHMLCDVCFSRAPQAAFFFCTWALIAQLVLYAAIAYRLYNTARAGSRVFSIRGAGFVETLLPVIAAVFGALGFGLELLNAAVAPWYAAELAWFARAALAVGSMSGWLHLGGGLLLSNESTGPFIVMLVRILTADLSRFFLVALAIVVAFTQAHAFLVPHKGGSELISQLARYLQDLLLDNIEPEKSESLMLIALDFSFSVVSKVVLMNILIALMNNTYSHVAEESTALYHLERARIIYAFERDSTVEGRLSKDCETWFTLPARGDIGMQPFLQIEDVDDAAYTTPASEKKHTDALREVDKCTAEKAATSKAAPSAAAVAAVPASASVATKRAASRASRAAAREVVAAVAAVAGAVGASAELEKRRESRTPASLHAAKSPRGRASSRA